MVPNLLSIRLSVLALSPKFLLKSVWALFKDKTFLTIAPKATSNKLAGERAFFKFSPNLDVKVPKALKSLSPVAAATCPNLRVSSIASLTPNGGKPNFCNALSKPPNNWGPNPSSLLIFSLVSRTPSKPAL